MIYTDSLYLLYPLYPPPTTPPPHTHTQTLTVLGHNGQSARVPLLRVLNLGAPRVHLIRYYKPLRT